MSLVSTDTITPVLLLAGEHPPVYKEVTIAAGEGVLAAGAVLAKITDGAATGSAVTGSGNGTIGSITRGLLAQVGAYLLSCIAAPVGAITTPTTGTAGTNAGANTMTGVTAGAAVKAGTYRMVCIDAETGGSEVYQVTDPEGSLLPNATVGVAYTNAQINFTINDPGANAQVGDSFTVLASAAAGNAGTFSVKAPSGEMLPNATVGVAYVNPHINFTITDGSADFVVGDTFTITVAAGNSQYKRVNKTDTDGGAVARAVLAAAVDATSAATGVALVHGEPNSGAFSYDNGTVLADVQADLEAVGIYPKTLA